MNINFLSNIQMYYSGFFYPSIIWLIQFVLFTSEQKNNIQQQIKLNVLYFK